MRLKINHLHVWQIDLTCDATQIAHYEKLLNEAETERACRFQNGLHRERFITARGSLRRILSAYLNIAPQAIIFEHNEWGKPFLLNNPIHFNLSHSENLALIAISHEAVGIDIEKIKNKDLSDLTARFFSPAEQAALAALPQQEKITSFYWLWSRKEALIKACGKGLSRTLASFSALPLRGNSLIELETAWHLYTIDAYPGYAASLASQSAPFAIEFFALKGEQMQSVNLWQF